MLFKLAFLLANVIVFASGTTCYQCINVIGATSAPITPPGNNYGTGCEIGSLNPAYLMACENRPGSTPIGCSTIQAQVEGKQVTFRGCANQEDGNSITNGCRNSPVTPEYWNSQVKEIDEIFFPNNPQFGPTPPAGLTARECFCQEDACNSGQTESTTPNDGSQINKSGAVLLLSLILLLIKY